MVEMIRLERFKLFLLSSNTKLKLLNLFIQRIGLKYLEYVLLNKTFFLIQENDGENRRPRQPDGPRVPQHPPRSLLHGPS